MASAVNMEKVVGMDGRGKGGKGWKTWFVELAVLDNGGELWVWSLTPRQ